MVNYTGCIVDVDEDVVLYSVQYEDGDGEDLSVVECKMVVEYMQSMVQLQGVGKFPSNWEISGNHIVGDGRESGVGNVN